MNNARIPKDEIVYLAIGEAVTAALITLVYLIIGKFSYTVPLGAILGGTVTVLNFLFLSVSLNRALDRTLLGVDLERVKRAYEERDAKEREKDESETESDAKDKDEAPEYEKIIAKYETEQKQSLASAVKLSYLIRNACIVGTLILAYFSRQFDVIATVIPLFMLRPILTVAELKRRKED